LIAVTFAGDLQAQTWTEFGPEARFAHTGVWDQSSNNMVVFGGQDPSTKTNLNDVWLIQTSIFKQIVATQLLPTGTAPSPRFGHVAVYDGTPNIMTVFGGSVGTTNTCSNDLWLLEGANGQSGTPAWVPVTANGTLPAARFHASVAYDPTTHSMILFGGNNCSKTYFNDVWVLSNADGIGGTPTWKQLSPSGAAPAAREGQSAIYDSVNNIMTIYGGDANNVQDSDIWTLSNANGAAGTPVWTQLASSGAIPLARTGHSAIYDATNNRMTVFGGFHFNTALTDTDVLTNANGLGGAPVWSKVTVTGTAPGLGYASTAYDTGANNMYVFAGSSSASKLSGDNHVFAMSNPNGIGSSIWIRGGPATRYAQSMFYDSVSASLFVFAGSHSLTNTNFSDYWQLNNATTSTGLSWFPVNVKGNSKPSARWGHAAQYDSASNRLMVFGGAQGFPTPCLNDFWIMTGANNHNATPTWVKETVSGTLPAARFHTATVYDSNNNSLVVFGGGNCGSTYFNDVWVLNNANGTSGALSWTQLAPAGTAPSQRENASAVFNASTNTITYYGGDTGGSAALNDIWVLTLSTTGGAPAWSQITPSNLGPVARTTHTATYDPVSNNMTIYGGYNGSALLSDAWVLSNANGQGGISTWMQINPQSPGTARRYHSSIYDPVTDQIVTFGGINQLSPFETDDHTFSLTKANGVQ
jgi:hypothetical protein